MSVLTYAIEQGKTEKSVARQCVLNKAPIPEPILNAPMLFEGLQLHYEAFLELTRTRQHTVNGTELPIHWKEYLDYCSAYSIDGEQRDDFVYVLKQLDDRYLSYRRLKQNAT